jgi:hypothetical protein
MVMLALLCATTAFAQGYSRDPRGRPPGVQREQLPPGPRPGPPQHAGRPDQSMTREERQELHRDLEQANRQIYQQRSDGGRR